MFYLRFCNNSDWLFVCVKSYLVSDYVSTLVQSRSLSLHYWQKLSATCRKETMKEAKTIAQARQPPSCGSPTSITFSQLHSIGFLIETARKFILSVGSTTRPIVSSSFCSICWKSYVPNSMFCSCPTCFPVSYVSLSLSLSTLPCQ